MQAQVVQDIPALRRADSNITSLNNGNDVPNAAPPFANSLMSSSKVGAFGSLCHLHPLNSMDCCQCHIQHCLSGSILSVRR